MAKRQAHLVGSIPADSAAEAMRMAMDRLAPYLMTLPDGETGARRNWIINIIESLRSHPDLELTRDGSWSGYEDLPRFKVRHGHRLYGATLDFGHVEAAQDSWPDFEKARADAGNPDLGFLIGIPGDFDMAMFALRRSPRPPSGRSSRSSGCWAGRPSSRSRSPPNSSCWPGFPAPAGRPPPASSPGASPAWPPPAPRAPASGSTCASAT
jgi:hypothetical protein